MFAGFIYADAAEQQARSQAAAGALESRKAEAGIAKTEADTELAKAKTAKEKGGGGFELNKTQALAAEAMRDPNSQLGQLWAFIQKGKEDIALKQAQQRNDVQVAGEQQQLINKQTQLDNTDFSKQTLYKGQKFADPITGQIYTQGKTPNDIKAEGLIRVSPTDEALLRGARSTMTNLQTVREQADKVLSDQGQGMLAAANTLGSAVMAQAEAEVGQNPEVTQFKTASKLTKMPILRIIGEKGNVSDVDMEQVQDITLRDSKASAKKKLDIFEKLVMDNMSAMGFKPSALSPSGSLITPSGQKIEGPAKGPEIDLDEQTLGKAYNALKAKYPKMTDQELGTLFRSQMQKQYLGAE